MGHHIDKDGNFQSDKNKELPPNKITLSFKDPAAVKALWLYSNESADPELASDIKTVILSKFKHDLPETFDNLLDFERKWGPGSVVFYRDGKVTLRMKDFAGSYPQYVDDEDGQLCVKLKRGGTYLVEEKRFQRYLDDYMKIQSLLAY